MSDVLRQEIATAADTVVVKVGTRVLTRDDGSLDETRIATLTEDLVALIDGGRRVALVSLVKSAESYRFLAFLRLPVI